MRGLYRDFFFHFDILVMFFLLLFELVFVLIAGVTFSLILFFLLGFIVFVLSEYFTHRFLFHIKPPKNAFFLKFLKRIHYDHHLYPNDLRLLFLPLWYSLPNFLVLGAVCYYFSGDFTETLAFGLGLMGMLLTYEWKHYVAHRPLKPQTKFGKWIKKVHILHHYKNENYWFGVSSPFIDILLGTYKEEKAVETSKTAKNLEM